MLAPFRDVVRLDPLDHGVLASVVGERISLVRTPKLKALPRCPLWNTPNQTRRVWCPKS